MSRPTHKATNASLQIVVPPGWQITITSVSRKTYRQVVRVSDDVTNNKRTFVSKLSKLNDLMTDTFSGATSMVLTMQEQTMTLDLNFYYSTNNALTTRQLVDDKYRSSKLHVLSPSRPQNAPKAIPDWVTFLALVEDAPNPQVVGVGQYGDAVATIHCIKDNKFNSGPRFNLANIQGDIAPGLPKTLQYFYFFQITNTARFSQSVKDVVLPRITTAADVKSKSPAEKEKLVGLNVAFSSLGLSKLGLSDSLQDESFEKGQLLDARDLGDSGTERGGHWSPDWDPEFKADIDGVFNVTARPQTEGEALQLIKRLDEAFVPDVRRQSIRRILVFRGSLRPGNNAPNDFFGFRDGISKPEIENVTFSKTEPMTFRGSSVVDMGVIVMGYDGDEHKATRPAWAVDGSFMVFRKLKTLAPEFTKMVKRESTRTFPNLDAAKAEDLFGARLVGRWKSGTPLVLSPNKDDPSIAADNDRVNDYNFDKLTDQSVCPFAVHVRKSNPRTEASKKHLFRRQSLPYGPEVHADEQETYDDRGLIFVCYQSSILNGFKYVQTKWYNHPDFPSAKSGYDPMLGQTGREHLGDHRFITGVNPAKQDDRINFLMKFVEPLGGEYFFVPSISTIRDRIAH